MTQERGNEAARLGAVGICDNVGDLNTLLAGAISEPIHVPDNLTALMRSEKPEVYGDNNNNTQEHSAIFYIVRYRG